MCAKEQCARRNPEEWCSNRGSTLRPCGRRTSDVRNRPRHRKHAQVSAAQALPFRQQTCFEGPFGELDLGPANGYMALQNPFRFSTKFQDDETGLLYYGYRYYTPTTGTWLSRDPVAEKGGINLYGLLRNDAQRRVDVLGLDIWPGPPIEIPPGTPGWPPPGSYPADSPQPRPPNPPSKPPSKPTSTPSPESSLGLYVCCRAVRPDENDPCLTRLCGKFIRHCNLSCDNASGKCDEGEDAFPIEIYSGGFMDNGKPCSKVTGADISSCHKRNSYNAGNGTWGNNCQSNARERLGKCCLQSTWQPNIYAYPPDTGGVPGWPPKPVPGEPPY
jgi:RHS repeat-associated protein